jgi:hypothetical protein
MSNEQSGPTGNFVGPETKAESVGSFQIQVTNAPFFGTGPGTAYVGINGGGWCYLTSDPGAATSFTATKDGEGRKFITTPNGWLSYQGATPYYLGSWRNISNEYQTWIEGGILHLHGGVMSFYSDGANTWLYNQSENTVGYTPCTVLPATAP